MMQTFIDACIRICRANSMSSPLILIISTQYVSPFLSRSQIRTIHYQEQLLIILCQSLDYPLVQGNCEHLSDLLSRILDYMLNHLIRLSKLFAVVSFPTTPTKIANYKSPLVPPTHLSRNFIHLIPLFLLLLKTNLPVTKKHQLICPCTPSCSISSLSDPYSFFSFSFNPSKKSKKCWNPTRFDRVGCPTWSS